MEPTVASLLLQFLVEFSHGVLPLLWNPEIQKEQVSIPCQKYYMYYVMYWVGI